MILAALYADRLTTLPGVAEGADPRLRLLHCRLERGPSAMSRVSVSLAGPDDAPPVVCRQEGTACPGGDLRLAALATLAALAQVAGGTCAFELIGVKPVRAFDATVIMVAAFATRDGVVTRIVGAAVVDGDPLIATARAACHAANRLAMPLVEAPSADA
jgi:hypothetical protein